MADMFPKKETLSVHPVDVLVGRNIRKWRKLRKLPIRELANRVGVTMQQLHKYEVAANRISASRLVDLAEVLDVPLLILLEEAECPQPDQGCLEKPSRSKKGGRKGRSSCAVPVLSAQGRCVASAKVAQCE